jgi:hypothetical protein
MCSCQGSRRLRPSCRQVRKLGVRLSARQAPFQTCGTPEPHRMHARPVLASWAGGFGQQRLWTCFAH